MPLLASSEYAIAIEGAVELRAVRTYGLRGLRRSPLSGVTAYEGLG